MQDRLTRILGAYDAVDQGGQTNRPRKLNWLDLKDKSQDRKDLARMEPSWRPPTNLSLKTLGPTRQVYRTESTKKKAKKAPHGVLGTCSLQQGRTFATATARWMIKKGHPTSHYRVQPEHALSTYHTTVDRGHWLWSGPGTSLTCSRGGFNSSLHAGMAHLGGHENGQTVVKWARKQRPAAQTRGIQINQGPDQARTIARAQNTRQTTQ